MSQSPAVDTRKEKGLHFADLTYPELQRPHVRRGSPPHLKILINLKLTWKLNITNLHEIDSLRLDIYSFSRSFLLFTSKCRLRSLPLHSRLQACRQSLISLPRWLRLVNRMWVWQNGQTLCHLSESRLYNVGIGTIIKVHWLISAASGLPWHRPASALCLPHINDRASKLSLAVIPGANISRIPCWSRTPAWASKWSWNAAYRRCSRAQGRLRGAHGADQQG